ncbi:phage/plasmid primase, P4 family [uncultured Lacinutrix sp.]|uniref:phage/plasmid primase, P4 family n=1 Tax=uncultured Lacinutrix sp. TaxID=574032 RepID=UPI0026179A47|nr:phage/plasmid primase, P4 family [uncultured Lacinutrix sp.]
MKDNKKGAKNSTNDFAKNQGKDTETSSIENIRANIKKNFLKSNRISLDAENLLNEIIKLIQPINFRKKVNLPKEDDKLQKKHYLVTTIEEIINIANKNGFSLCRSNSNIYIYNSEFWESVTDESFTDFLGLAALKLGIDKYESKHYKFKEELYKQFLSAGGLKSMSISKGTTLINLKNGTFEVSENMTALRKFKKEDFIKYQLPFSYNENAKSPLFQSFLNKVLPEKELQDILAEYLGSIFIKNDVLKLEKCLLLYGSGANGKSVFYEIVMALLGSENTTNYTLSSLTQDNSKSRINIEYKLLNYASEIDGKLKSDIFKSMVSGEPLPVQVLYKQDRVITEYAKLLFNCNELPKEVENTNAFFRRFIIIPFNVTIPEADQDKKLSNKIIKSELSGVFNWMLNGLERLLKQNDFTSSEIAEKEVLNYQKYSDSVLTFMEDENYIVSTTENYTLKNLYNEYKVYCIDSGMRCCSKKTFSTRLKKNNFEVIRKSYGISVYVEKKVF